MMDKAFHLLAEMNDDALPPEAFMDDVELIEACLVCSQHLTEATIDDCVRIRGVLCHPACAQEYFDE